MHLKKTIAGVLVAGVASTALLGCESIQRETGLKKETQVGAAAGAATGGIIAALANANPAWIAASVILGGIVGGVAGEYLSKDDALTHGKTQHSALNSLGPGQSRSWSNPKTGATGSTTVNEQFTMADRTVCKNFTETIKSGDRTVTEKGTACKKPGGTWEIKAG